MGEAHRPASRCLIAAVVGDVHDLWGTDDVLALRSLDVDLVLFVGDIGNENVQLVQQIADCPVPAAVCLGNHDAWGWGHRKATGPPSNKVAQQLELLGSKHVGYSSMVVPNKPATVVGGRPFSWGGSQLRPEALYQQLYDIRSPQQSARKILSCLQAAPDDHLLLMLAHNGPFGLGASADDICGADFLPRAGDWGDPDLTEALACAAEDNIVPALVAFGHMHDTLFRGSSQKRKRVVVDTHRGTVYLNAAVVPRVRRMPLAGAPPLRSEDWPTRRHFCVATLQEWGVETVKDVWLSVQPGGQCAVVEETVLLTTEPLPPQQQAQLQQPVPQRAGAPAADGGPWLVTRQVLDTSASVPAYNLVTSPCTLPRAASHHPPSGRQAAAFSVPSAAARLHMM